MTTADPTSNLHAAARAYVDRYYPGLQAVLVKIVLSDGRQVELPVAHGPASSSPGGETT